MNLSPAVQKFILHWGEMGPRWGVNRSVAQIHALLYMSETPLTAEEIAETLSLARSNVSVSLKELQGWRIVRQVPVLGDRREHFESLADVWEMFQTVLDERKRREIDPTLEVLRECIEQIDGQRGGSTEVRKRLEAMLSFFETVSTWYQQIRRLPRPAVIRFMKMGRKVQRMLGMPG